MDRRLNLQNAYEAMRKRTEKVHKMAIHQLMELVRTITRWEEAASKSDCAELCYNFQMLNSIVEEEITSRVSF